MYHCATQPVLLHTSAGMMGMMVVKPRDLAPVDRELWVTQEEFYLGQPGKPADMAKMAAQTPDVMAFNGYANQYKAHPITVRVGEKIRMYVLDAGPSKWSAFHVIGTVFDKTVVEGIVGHDAQTVSLRAEPGRLGRVHARRGGQLPVRDARLRRHGQGRGGHPAHDRRAEGRRTPTAAAHRQRPRGRRGRRKRRTPRSATCG